MANFKVGDTVKLKSGGPVMTVDDIDTTANPPEIYTVWIDANKKFTDKFKEHALKIWD